MYIRTPQHPFFFKQGSGKGHKNFQNQANSQVPGGRSSTSEYQDLTKREPTFRMSVLNGTSFERNLIYFLHSEYVVVSFLLRITMSNKTNY